MIYYIIISKGKERSYMHTHGKKHKKSGTRHYGVFVLLLTLLTLAVAFVLLTLKVQHDSDTPFTVHINTSEGQKSNDYIVNTIISKYWINDEGKDYQTYGAQYDCTIRNNSDYDITDWKIVIDVPTKDEIKIDSYWNGLYEFKDGKIIFTAGEKVDPIRKGLDASFGAIIISKGMMKFEDYELTGCTDKPITQYYTFWGILVLFIVWCTSVVAYIFYRLRERRFDQYRKDMDDLISQSMNTFANLIDAKDPYTRGHSTRVSFYTQRIAEAMGLHESEIKNLGYIALMHDCGKIGIPDDILTKPAKLTDEEYKTMQGHTTYGGEALKDFTAINGIVEGALYHHERYDGKGYPQKLKGDEIPLYARIICVADSLDAMNSDRCYRPHLSPEFIKKELKGNSGTQFDPEIVEIALELIEDGVIKLGTDKDKK